MATNQQTVQYKKAFLERFAATGNISRACRETGVARMSVYEWKANDPEFLAAFAEAETVGTELLEEHAWRRSTDGVTSVRPVYYEGERVGEYEEIRYSDVLLMFLLKARRPDVYRERHDIRHSGDPTAPIAYIEVPGEPGSAD